MQGYLHSGPSGIGNLFSAVNVVSGGLWRCSCRHFGVSEVRTGRYLGSPSCSKCKQSDHRLGDYLAARQSRNLLHFFRQSSVFVLAGKGKFGDRVDKSDSEWDDLADV